MSNISAGVSAALFCLLFLWISHSSFSSTGLWLPVITIVFFQTPAAYALGVLMKYVDVDKERKAIRHAFEFYLPQEIVDQIASDRSTITAGGRMVYGTFLCTDLERYTSFSENTDPVHLNQLMHHYYETLFEPVRKGGQASTSETDDRTQPTSAVHHQSGKDQTPHIPVELRENSYRIRH